jgi:N-acyl-D-amino-acid deacylase
MYSYTAGGTGLEACIPPWAHSGGRAALQTRLQDSAEREHIRQAMLTPTTEWENMFLGASPENIRLVAFSNPALRPLAGKTLAQVAIERGTSPDHTLLDLVTEDTGHIFAAYFMMSDANVERQLALPWVSLCSDAESLACEGLFLKSKPHPRAYGSFARFMGYYVRERSVTTLADAIRRMTHFPAQNLGLAQRGLLAEGYYADVVVFDPHTIQDHATYEQPHQYATGVQHVFVNGQHVLKGGKHTGALPGQVVRPGRANALSHPR